MAALTTVQAGDLITADRFNEVITRVNDLEAALAGLSVGSGSVTVPSLFGRTLAEARTIIMAPSAQLLLNAVLDAGGALLDPNLAANASRLVIAQTPGAGVRVSPGSSVNLTVSGTGGGGPVTLPPTISSTNPTTVNIGAVLQIFGNNFAPVFSNNVVRIDTVLATVQSNSNVGVLNVIVPPGIPGVGPGTRLGVPVTVTVAGLTPATTTVNVAPAIAGVPTIGNITPTIASVGNSITITGTNFAAGATVAFDNVGAVVPSNITSTTITVTVPTGITGLSASGSQRNNVPVTVTVGGLTSAPATQIVRQP